MHVFAIALLFGLGVMAVGLFAERFLGPRELWSVALVAIGIIAAWAAHFDVWQLWGVPIRGHWIGVTFTGLVLAGIAHLWYVVLGFFSGLFRKLNDEAASLEKAQELRRVA